MRQAWRLALSGLMASLLLVTASPVGASAEPSAEAGTRFMTWNLFAPGDAEPADYAREIARFRPAVIGVQEACKSAVDKTVEILREQGLRYHVRYGTVMSDRWNCGFWGGNAYGQAILSLTPLRNPVNRRYSQGGSEPRGWMAVTTTVNGKATRIFNTHLAQAGQADVRAVQVNELLRATRSYQRAVVLGDFNTEPHRPELRPIWNTFRDADPYCGAQENTLCTPTADASPHRKKFDYMLLRGIEPPGVQAIDSVHSDHDLVIAELAG